MVENCNTALYYCASLHVVNKFHVLLSATIGIAYVIKDRVISFNFETISYPLLNCGFCCFSLLKFLLTQILMLLQIKLRKRLQKGGIRFILLMRLLEWFAVPYLFTKSRWSTFIFLFLIVNFLCLKSYNLENLSSLVSCTITGLEKFPVIGFQKWGLFLIHFRCSIRHSHTYFMGFKLG